MFILLQHLNLPTGAAIAVSIIVIKAVKAGLARWPLSRPGHVTAATGDRGDDRNDR
jgi:hypothetical protein